MKKRAAETLTEVVTAMTLFGIILGGIFDFMGGEARYITQLNNHSQAMYALQKYVNGGEWQNADNDNNKLQDTALGLMFSYNPKDGKLRVEEINKNKMTDQSRHMTFILK